MLHLIQLVTLLITFPVTQVVYAQGCAVLWFGENCMYNCNCDRNALCDNLGNCPGNKCGRLFFGPACQFRSCLDFPLEIGFFSQCRVQFYSGVRHSSSESNGKLLTYNAKRITIQPIMLESDKQRSENGDLVLRNSVNKTQTYINDHNISTCNPNATATTIQVTLDGAFLFGWFRIEVKDRRNILNFTVQLDSVPCSNERKFPGNKFVDVTCDMENTSLSLTIKGLIVPDICSIYISGGRNVALKQNTIQASTYDYNGPFKAVDGNKNTSFSNGSCTHTNKQDNPWWTVTYNRPQKLLLIQIVNRSDLRYRLQGFILEAFDDTGSKILQHQADLYVPLLLYKVLGTVTSPIRKIKITGYNHADTDDHILTLCEVETFGETVCPDGTYGLWCGEKCQCQGTDVCNPVTGVCASGCDPGFYGFNCSSQCSYCLDGLCTNRQGKCFGCPLGKVGVYCENDCESGFYGVNCTTPCSLLCLEGECISSDGMCLQCHRGYRGSYCKDACDSGYYGENCEFACGKLCEHGLCTHQDGKCIHCQVGYQGDNCEKKCRGGFFGKNCKSECSKRCANVCDYVTGNCSCKEDFAGDSCSDCVAGKYGERCAHKCSDVCSCPECNGTTGKCLPCDRKHSGASEGSIPSDVLWWMSILLISGLTAAVCWFIVNLKQTNSLTYVGP